MTKKLDNLTFDETTHTYLVNGIEIPSVTSLMKPLSSCEYNGIPESVLMRAAEKGTAVHSAIEYLLKYGIEDIPREYSGYLEAYKKWAESHEIELIQSEGKFYHPVLMYAGTADMVAKIDGHICLVDFKTTSKLMSNLVAVQLEAYAQMLRNFGIVVEKKIALQLKKDGTFHAEEFEGNDAKRWSVFLSLLTIYNYTKTLK